MLDKLEAVERAALKGAALRLELDAAIREAHEAGASLRQIAKAADKSHEYVRQVVSRD